MTQLHSHHEHDQTHDGQGHHVHHHEHDHHDHNHHAHSSPETTPSIPANSPSRRLRWLKAGLALLALWGCGYLLWNLWPQILLTSIHWQRDIITQLSDLLQDANQSTTAMASLVEISFIYGIFHSLGPGHGKMIVSTYLATHPTKVRVSLWITIISALVQALVAIVLVSVFLLVIHTTIRQVNQTVGHFIQASSIGVMLLGFFITAQGGRQYLRKQPVSLDENKHHHSEQHEHHHLDQHEHHTHSDGTCSCGHKHAATSAEINQASSLKEYAVLVMSIGIRPCTGAILVLFFANLANMYWLGVISALLMAVGTALTTSTIALMTVSGRQLVRRYLSISSGTSSRMNAILRLVAGILLILLSLLLLQQGSMGMSPFL